MKKQKTPFSQSENHNQSWNQLKFCLTAIDHKLNFFLRKKSWSSMFGLSRDKSFNLFCSLTLKTENSAWKTQVKTSSLLIWTLWELSIRTRALLNCTNNSAWWFQNLLMTLMNCQFTKEIDRVWFLPNFHYFHLVTSFKYRYLYEFINEECKLINSKNNRFSNAWVKNRKTEIRRV